MSVSRRYHESVTDVTDVSTAPFALPATDVTAKLTDPGAARLDQATENELYALYRAYFADAEETRAWSVAEAIPPDLAYPAPPSPALLAAAHACHNAELFLPDYQATLLKYTRGSRARAWYVTRWAYEEVKHLLALGEWLIRRGVATSETLEEQLSDSLGAARWQPPSTEATALFADAALYETQEIERYRRLKEAAQAEGDAALVGLCDHILADERAQYDFFSRALEIIKVRHPAKHEEAMRIVSPAA